MGGCTRCTGLGEEPTAIPGKLIGNELGFYLWKGEHEFIPENWDARLTFANRHFRKP